MSKAKVVYERDESFSLMHGPSSYRRVGFCIGDRVFWTGCENSHVASPDFSRDFELAHTIVERWNASERG